MHDMRLQSLKSTVSWGKKQKGRERTLSNWVVREKKRGKFTVLQEKKGKNQDHNSSSPNKIK